MKNWEKRIAELKGFVLDYDRCQELKDSLAETLSMTKEEIERYF